MTVLSRFVTAAVLAAGAGAVTAPALAAPAASAAPPPQTTAVVTGRPVRIMPLGDSITWGVGSSSTSSYRASLWNRLVGAAGLAVDFVGSQRSGTLPDTDNEGHSGWRIDQLTAQIDGWLATSQPDVILLHIGTNDLNQNVDVANAPARLAALLDRIWLDRPATTVIVAAIVPTTDAVVNARVTRFNAALPAIVAQRANAGRDARFANLNATMTTADMADGLHPNDAGYGKMASLWHSALKDVLGGGRDWPLWRSGLEPAETLPSWTDTVDSSAGVGGFDAGATGMQSAARATNPHGASNALLYSGNDLSATSSFSYNRVFDVNLRLAADSVLTYWIFPQQRNATYVAVDLVFTDGSSLRDSGLVDQFGVRAHPRFQGDGGRLALNQWNLVRVNLGALAGRVVDRVHLGYDQAPATGVFRGFVDDLQIADSPRQAANAAAAVNLALKRPATGSAGCAATEGPARANDGTAVGGSKWCAGAAAAQWQVDLGAVTTVRTVQVRLASAGGEALASNARGFRVQTSVDGVAWQPFATVTGNADGVTTSTAAAVSARHVRLIVDAPAQTGAAVARIYEVEVYAA